MEINIERIKDYSEELVLQINKLLKQLDETAAPLTENDVRGMISSPINKLFVARELENNKIVGMISLIIFRIPYSKKGFLEDLVVDEKCRGKGIGTKLILNAVNEARKENVKCLDFTSSPKRVAANNLYQGLGFKKRETNVYRIEL